MLNFLNEYFDKLPPGDHLFRHNKSRALLSALLNNSNQSLQKLCDKFTMSDIDALLNELLPSNVGAIMTPASQLADVDMFKNWCVYNTLTEELFNLEGRGYKCQIL